MASLLISPLIGFVMAAFLYVLIKRLANDPRLDSLARGRRASASLDPGDPGGDLLGS